MRTRRPGSVMLLLATVLLCPPVSDAHAAEVHPAGTPTRLAGLDMSLSRLSVSGKELANLSVTAHLVDPDGVAVESTFDGGEDYFPCPCVLLERTTPALDPQAAGTLLLPLLLAGGTPEDGFWSLNTDLAAADAGTWTVAAIGGGDFRDPLKSGGSELVPVAGLGPAVPRVTLRGSEWLRLGLEYPASVRIPARNGAPASVRGPVILSGRAYFAGGSRPAARVRLTVADGDCGAQDACHVLGNVRTDVRGRWTLRVPRIFGPATVEYPARRVIGTGYAGKPLVSTPLVLASGEFDRVAARVGTPRYTKVRGRRQAALPVTLQWAPSASRAGVTLSLQRWTGNTWATVRRVRTSNLRTVVRTYPPTGLSFYRLTVSDPGDLTKGAPHPSSDVVLRG